MNATYSPEDNKLRLYPDGRLDAETYARVKAAGFIWAPKQGLFVAPKWTPGREDLLIELCGEVGDEDTSLVDRAEQRAERFEDYSESRAKDAHHAHAAVSSIADGIPLGQPILIGHHSERHARRDAEKIENGMRRAVKAWETSQYWQSRAKGAIRAAKYKELPGVRARRIKTLEAERRSLIADYTPAYPDQPPIMQTHWNWSPSSPDLTVEQIDAEREAARVPHVYTGPKGRGGRWVPVASLERIKAGNARSIAHLENRIAYERAMLEESGATDLLKPKPRPAQLPLLNYRAPSGVLVQNMYHRGEFNKLPQVEMTQAQYSAINEDYKGTRVVGNSHRVRSAMIRHDLVVVFLTDSKVHPIPGDIEVAPEPIQVREHVPSTPPEPTVFDAMKDSLRAGVQVVTAPQLFPTPPELAARMVELADVQPGECVLEPSAGTGRIIDEIPAHCELIAVEINNALCRRLHTMPGVSRTVEGDFLECNGNLGKFDVVLMNPPFENGSDIKHIKHALTFLKPGGRLVAVCANGPRQNEQLKPLMDTWEVLPSGTFAGTGVSAALMTLEVKP